jgi:subtilisin family serine protease
MKKFLIILGLAVATAVPATSSYAQGTAVKELPRGWHLLDKDKDGFYGISLEQAYNFVKGKKSTPIVVAVIDSGIDTLHEDLKEVLWKNPGEIPGNGIDDDKNGYTDDVYGWNFIGGKDGRNVKEDSYEGARVYHKFRAVYGNKQVDTAALSATEKEQYRMWLRAKTQIEGESSDGGVDVLIMQKALESSLKSDSILRKALGKDTYTGKDLDAFAATESDAQKAKAALLYLFKANNMMETTNKEFLEGFQEFVNGELKKKESKTVAPKNYRGEIVKDNESDINDRFYGNNDVMANTPFHGTHVSGIIAAKRNNGKGVDGIADNVRIMTIRAVPDGDEHDKDVALAIRYAVDNGARVVNMSFGKSFSPEKNWVDEAVKYAESKNVLLIHAAGNDANNVDTAENYPSPLILATGQKAPNWITVGASSDPLAEPGFKSYTASFSNYGKSNVDVFSPGTKIYSTIPGGTTYGTAQGTSMASPVVAGVAAMILNYYPGLSAKQVKYVIEKSATAPPAKVKIPGSDDTVQMADISVSGGIVNAHEALKLAATLKPENVKQELPKSTLKKSKKN